MTKKIKFSEEEKMNIIQLYEINLMNMKTIAEKLGVSTPVIHNFLRNQNINTTQKNRKRKLFDSNKLKPSGAAKYGDENYSRKYGSPIKNKTFEEIHGKQRAKEIKNKLSVLHKNKTLEEMYGEIKAKEIKEKIGNHSKQIKRTEEWKKNMSLSHKGKLAGKNHPRYGIKGEDNPLYRRRCSPETEFKKGMIPWNKGKNSEEYPNILSKENHYNWQGGKSFQPYDLSFNNKFKRAIRKRDNHECLKCGIHQEKLSKALTIHHINYDKKLTIPQNCCALCFKCNSEVNFNRHLWTEFFQSLLKELYNYSYSDVGEIILNLNNQNEN